MQLMRSWYFTGEGVDKGGC